MTRWLPLPLALLAGVLGFLWSRDRAEFRAAASELRASRDSAYHQLDVAYSERDSADQVHASELAQLDSARRATDERRAAAVVDESRAVEAVAAAGADLDSSLDTLERRAPPELAPLVGSARAQLALERAAHGSVAAALREQVQTSALMLAAADSTIILQNEQLGARDRLITSLEGALSEERRSREFFEAEASPSFLRGILRDLPRFAVVGAVAGGVGLLAGIALR